MTRPVDGMFRAGQISSKEWARLHPNEHGGGKGSQKSKMAKFEAKDKDEGTAQQNRAVAGTKRRHIDGPDQGMGKPAHAGGKPSRGGDAHGNAGQAGHIDTHQKPNFPRQGAGNAARKTLGKQQPSSSQHPAVTNADGWYGGPSRRYETPARLAKVTSNGGKL